MRPVLGPAKALPLLWGLSQPPGPRSSEADSCQVWSDNQATQGHSCPHCPAAPSTPAVPWGPPGYADPEAQGVALEPLWTSVSSYAIVGVS